MLFLGGRDSVGDEIKLGLCTQPAGQTGSDLIGIELANGRDFGPYRRESFGASQHNLAIGGRFRLFFTASTTAHSGETSFAVTQRRTGREK